MTDLKDAARVKGTLHYRVYRRGLLIEEVEEHNIVVDSGRMRLAQLIAGKTSDPVKYIGFGSGSSIAKLSDTTLTNQFLKEIVSSKVEGPDAIFSWYLSETDANGLDIREFGLFAADATMLTRQVRGKVIGKEADITIEGTYTLHF